MRKCPIGELATGVIDSATSVVDSIEYQTDSRQLMQNSCRIFLGPVHEMCPLCAERFPFERLTTLSHDASQSDDIQSIAAALYDLVSHGAGIGTARCPGSLSRTSRLSSKMNDWHVLVCFKSSMIHFCHAIGNTCPFLPASIDMAKIIPS